MDENLTPFAPDLAAANTKHDAEHGDPYTYDMTRIRSAWNESRLLRKGKLSDRKIAGYENRGYYSADFKAARRELWERRAKKRAARQGNFDLVEGRMIYRP